MPSWAGGEVPRAGEVSCGGADGLWDGDACFPASYTASEPGQPWTATKQDLQTLHTFGLDPAFEAASSAISLVANHGRWEHAGSGTSTARSSRASTAGRSRRAPATRWTSRCSSTGSSASSSLMADGPARPRTDPCAPGPTRRSRCSTAYSNSRVYRRGRLGARAATHEGGAQQFHRTISDDDRPV